tara:strand:+ start:88 stop:969 length:882 start_codon:yes stop_codon:yes gene_type:complete
MRRSRLILYLCLGLAAQLATVHAQDSQEPIENVGTAAGEVAEVTSPTRSERQEQALRALTPTAEQRQLEVGDDTSMGLFLAAAQPRPRGGILLIADRNEHADWPELVGPARRKLSTLGWHTLSISLPNAATGVPNLEESVRIELATQREALATRRINAAAQALAAEGSEVLVVLGRGEGAFWALHATSSTAEPSVKADALILYQTRPPLGADSSDTRIEELLAQWKKPVYDIFNGQHEANKNRAHKHELDARRQGNTQYKQLVLPQQDQSALGQQMLVKRLQGWLNKAVAQQP